MTTVKAISDGHELQDEIYVLQIVHSMKSICHCGDFVSESRDLADCRRQRKSDNRPQSIHGHCRFGSQVLIDRNLIERRNRGSFLASRIAGGQQMELRHFVGQRSDLEQFVSDRRRRGYFLAVVCECLDRLLVIASISPDRSRCGTTACFTWTGLRFIFQQRITQAGSKPGLVRQSRERRRWPTCSKPKSTPNSCAS